MVIFRGSIPIFVWREIVKTTLSTPERYSNLDGDIPINGSLVYCESSAFDRAAIEADILYLVDVILSAIGALIWVAGLTTWIVTFQTQRAQWGETADYMSFIIPTGIA
uniref:Uncharacterized protein n=1 Tax=Timema poppense TaxID=170557 RepID=A0A7R9CVK4_TIMPO|nr:unnamed protein product [Timema poppensis]